MVDDPAVRAPIHRIAGTPDKALPELFAPDYVQRHVLAFGLAGRCHQGDQIAAALRHHALGISRPLTTLGIT
ncbi:hypothetical protein [Streptomyces sp. NPDC051001]|uniref:hypothetical protein n=1 Tax=Streptomyces sp. NPDC051001 TaxID=3155795 RepID=UPI0034176B48